VRKPPDALTTGLSRGIGSIVNADLSLPISLAGTVAIY
jgi:hypothetical protein